MKLKYYLRGLGIGILVTALLFMTIIVPEKKKLTDQEIIVAAEKLGMTMKVESTLDLDDIMWDITPSAIPSDPISPSATEIPEPPKPTLPVDSVTPEPEITIPEPTLTVIPILTNTPIPSPPPKLPTPTETPQITPSMLPNPTIEPTNTNQPTDGANEISSTPEPTKKPEYITVQITAGMYSAEISRLLQSKGLVNSAEKFDKYLMDEGYADRLKFNTYKIPIGASYQEIAEILTKKTYQIP